MTERTEEVGYQGNLYRITRLGNGLFLAVDRLEDEGGTVVDIFHCQGDDADEFDDLYNEHGATKLLEYLDSAGVEL